MGFVLDLFKGAPDLQKATLDNPFTGTGVNDANAKAVGGLDQQQSFVNALSGQNGIGNQANVFSQQQQLANTLGQQVAGNGPNPAQAALQQATGQNVAQQSALMGSQRGASQNAGLIARQAAQQGAGIQQQAVGQAATLQAQQQIAAQQQLAQQQAQMAALASQQVGQQAQGLGQYNQAAQGLANFQQQGLQGQNQLNLGQAQGINNNLTAQYTGNQGNQADILSKAAGAAGTALQKLPFAHGGQVPEASHVASYFADGGWVPSLSPVVPGKARYAGDSMKNDTVPAMLSPGEIVVPREAAQDPKKAASFAAAVAMKGKRK